MFGKFFFRLIVITAFILALFYAWNYYNSDSQNNNIEKQQKSNSNNFKKIGGNTLSDLAKSGVALSTGIGIGKNNRIATGMNSNNISIEEIIKNIKDNNEDIITTNMMILREYYTIIKTDIKKTLAQSKNRSETLKNILQQLSIRYKLAERQQKVLQNQKAVLLQEMQKYDEQIIQIRKKIEADFKSLKSSESEANLQEYLEIKEKHTKAKTYVVYINEFLKRYTTLNNYNGKMIQALKTNQDAITKESYVVIPSYGTKILKDFDLIYGEQEFEEIQKQQKEKE